MSVETRISELRTKVGEKLQWLKDQIALIDSVGRSDDPGNDLILGTDQKLFFKRYTASEIADLYEGLADRNQFTDALKTSIEANSAALPNKADLENGKIRSTQIPDFTFSNILAPTETTIEAFVAALPKPEYIFYEGWLIAIQMDDGSGGTEVQNYFFLGGEPEDILNYAPVNTVTVHWDNIAGKPDVETITGSQAKADQAETNAKAYTDTRETILQGNIDNKVEKVAGKGLSPEEYTLTEKNKLSGIEDGATADQTGSEIKIAYEAEPNTNAFTDAEKTKLAGVESSKFKGVFASVSALETAEPSPESGSYAYVDAGPGNDAVEYIWDTDEGWVEGNTTGSTETAATIKTKYESNADTNAFTDALLSKLDSITAIFTTALKTAYDTASDWVSNNGQNVLDHVTKFTNNVAGQVPVSQADGSIVWEDKATGGGGETATFKEDSYTWNTGDPNTFTVDDSAKVTDIYLNGKRLEKFEEDGVTADEWQINDATTIEILVGLTDTDKISIIASSVGVASSGNSGGSSLDFIFKANKNNRAWQGVGVTSSHIYICSDRDENFSLNNSIQKYNHKGDLVSEKTSAYTLTNPSGKFMSFGSTIHIEGGFLYIPVYDVNGGGAAPYISRVAKFNADTLAYIEEFEIGNGVAESIWKYNGEYYISYYDIMKIRKFNTSWVQQAEYNLSPAMKPDGGYQAIFYEDGFWYMNWHGSNDYTGSYTPGLDKYTFDGSAFTFVENLDAPTFGAGQGVVPYDGKYYWVDRPADKIIVTTKLGIKVPVEKDIEEAVVIPSDLEVNTLKATTSIESQDIIIPSATQRVNFKSGGAASVYLDIGTGTVDGSFIFTKQAVLKYLFGYDASPEGFRIYNYAQSSPIFFNPNGSKKIGLNGKTDPKSALDVDGGVKVANDADAASANKVGTLRYRTSGNTSYCEMCMQTGASTYAWEVITSKTW